MTEEHADRVRMHVFADLQPYICTFDDCRSMLLTFPNRMAWSQHELTKHRICQSWTCHLCAGTFSADATFVKHLQLKHDLPLHHCKILAASSLTKATEPGASTNKQCPLCLQKGWSNHRRFITHLGRHLEEIALSVLPREVDSDSDQRSDADEVSDDATLCLVKVGLLERSTKKHKETHERPGSSYNDETDGAINRERCDQTNWPINAEEFAESHDTKRSINPEGEVHNKHQSDSREWYCQLCPCDRDNLQPFTHADDLKAHFELRHLPFSAEFRLVVPEPGHPLDITFDDFLKAGYIGETPKNDVGDSYKGQDVPFF
jgi:hypothetical protein